MGENVPTNVPPNRASEIPKGTPVDITTGKPVPIVPPPVPQHGFTGADLQANAAIRAAARQQGKTLSPAQVKIERIKKLQTNLSQPLPGPQGDTQVEKQQSGAAMAQQRAAETQELQTLTSPVPGAATTLPPGTPAAQPLPSQAPGATRVQGTPIDQDPMPQPPPSMTSTPEGAYQNSLFQWLTRKQDRELQAVKSETAKEEKIAFQTKAEETAAAEATKAAQEKLNREVQQETHRRNEEAERAQIAYHDLQQRMFDLDQTRAEQVQRDANIDSELYNRRVAAKLGFSMDPSGVKWMKEQSQKGAQALSYIIQKGALAREGFVQSYDGIMRDYRNTMKDIDSQWASNNATAYKDYKNEIKAIKSDYSVGAKERRGLVRDAQKTYSTTLNTVAMKVGDMYAEQAKEARERADKVEENKKKSNEALENRYWKSVQAGLGPEAIQGTINAMNSAGMDTAWIDPNAMSSSERDKRMKEKSRTQVIGNIGKHVDPRTGIDMVSLLDHSVSASKWSEEERASKIDKGIAFLQSGNVKAFKTDVYLNATQNLAPATAANVANRIFAQKAMSRAEDMLAQYKKDDLGFYTAILEGKKKFANVDRNQKFVQFRAALGMVQSEISKELFGVALTDNEKTLRQDFLVDFREDKVGTALTKMLELSRNNQSFIESQYDQVLGLGTFKSFLGDVWKDVDVSKPTFQGSSANDDFGSQWEGKPMSSNTLLDAFAFAHQTHEGFGTAGAPTITRQNNPGALKWHDAHVAFGGTKGENGFTSFPSYEKGRAALMADVRTKLKGKSEHIDYSKNPTLLSYAEVYAPRSAGNDPVAYARALARALPMLRHKHNP
jgi:hypothetical protein